MNPSLRPPGITQEIKEQPNTFSKNLSQNTDTNKNKTEHGIKPIYQLDSATCQYGQSTSINFS